MRLHGLAAIALAVLVVGAGAAAAMPGNADGQSDEAENGHADDAGPPSDLPGPVPDFVTGIHDLIAQFLNGDLGGSLGDAISGVTPGGGQSNG